MGPSPIPGSFWAIFGNPTVPSPISGSFRAIFGNPTAPSPIPGSFWVIFGGPRLFSLTPGSFGGSCFGFFSAVLGSPGWARCTLGSCARFWWCQLGIGEGVPKVRVTPTPVPQQHFGGAGRKGGDPHPLFIFRAQLRRGFGVCEARDGGGMIFQLILGYPQCFGGTFWGFIFGGDTLGVPQAVPEENESTRELLGQGRDGLGVQPPKPPQNLPPLLLGAPSPPPARPASVSPPAPWGE